MHVVRVGGKERGRQWLRVRGGERETLDLCGIQYKEVGLPLDKGQRQFKLCHVRNPPPFPSPSATLRGSCS